MRGQIKEQFLLDASEGLTESTIILGRPGEPDSRTLFTNGHPMSGTAPWAQRYMRGMVHLPLLSSRSPSRALVICFGVGNTAHAASLYSSLKSLEVVDLSKHVLGKAGFFAETNGNVLQNPKVSVFVNDGRQHLRINRSYKYDLITLEPPPLTFAGVSSLYSKEFYHLAKRNLTGSGFVTQWLPIRQTPLEVTRSLIAAFLDAFPNAVLLNGDYENLILMGRNGDGPIEFDPELVDRNIEHEPLVRRDLSRHFLLKNLDLAGTFVAGPAALRKASAEAAPASDDEPAMEYAELFVLSSVVPRDVFDPSELRAWCPKCDRGVGTDFSFRDLEAYSKFIQSMYQDQSFLWIGPLHFRTPPVKLMGLSKAQAAEITGKSAYLRELSGRLDLSGIRYLGE